MLACFFIPWQIGRPEAPPWRFRPYPRHFFMFVHALVRAEAGFRPSQNRNGALGMAVGLSS